MSEEQIEDSGRHGIKTTQNMNIASRDEEKTSQNVFTAVPDHTTAETIEARFNDYDLNKRIKIEVDNQELYELDGTNNPQPITVNIEATEKHYLDQQKASHVTVENGDIADLTFGGNSGIPDDFGIEKRADDIPENYLLSAIAEITETNDYIITDYENKLIRVVNSDYRVVSQCSCIFQPWDIAVVDPTLLIVSFPFVRLLQFFKVRPKRQLAPWYPLVSGNEYYGIAYDRGHVIATCLYDDSSAGPCVHVMNKGGIIQNKIRKDSNGKDLFVEPTYIAVSENSHVIYVLDQGNKSIISFTREGEGMLVVNDVCEDPTGLAVESTKGLVFVGDRGTKSVIVLNDTLKVIQLIKARDDDIWTPLSLYLCERSARLLATTDNSTVLRALQI